VEGIREGKLESYASSRGGGRLMKAEKERERGEDVKLMVDEKDMGEDTIDQILLGHV
jgi:hypothetical protein